MLTSKILQHRLLLIRATILALLLVAAMLLPASASGLPANRGGVLQGLYDFDQSHSNGNENKQDDDDYSRLSFGSVALLDEDFREMERGLSSYTVSENPESNFELSQHIFEKGIHSEPYAILTISDPEFVRREIPPGTRVRGTSESGATIHGICHVGSGVGNVTLVVHYPPGGTDDHPDVDPISGLIKSATHDGERCEVGWSDNPAPDTTGCFVASGSVEIELMIYGGDDENIFVDEATTMADGSSSSNSTSNSTTLANETATATTAPTTTTDSPQPELLYFDYSYDPLESNSNALSLATLQGDRTEPYQSSLQKYISFYSTPDFDTQWLLAAYENRKTPGFEFLFNGNPVPVDMDFSELDFEGRYAAIKWGTVTVKLWIFIVESLEEAIGVCGTGASSPNPTKVYEDALHRWDRAVAAHTGSGPILGEDNNNGYFLYNMIQEECQYFGTCTKSDSMAPLNRDILQIFRDGRESMRVGNCFGAASHARKLVPKLTIPLIQGAWRNSYLIDQREDYSGMALGQMAAYAAGIAPMMFDCNFGQAWQFYEGIGPGRSKRTSYQVVRGALEQTYTCLGVTCAEVGGLINKNYMSGAGGGTPFLPDAAPCGLEDTDGGLGQDAQDPWEVAEQTNKLNSTERYVIVVSIVSGIVVGILVALFFRYGRRIQDTWQNWWWKRDKALELQKEKERQRQATLEISGSSKHMGHRDRSKRSSSHRRGSSTKRMEFSESGSERVGRATASLSPLDDLESLDDDSSFADVDAALE